MKREFVASPFPSLQPRLAQGIKKLISYRLILIWDVFAQKSSENLGFILRTSAASARASFSRPIILYVAVNIT